MGNKGRTAKAFFGFELRRAMSRLLRLLPLLVLLSAAAAGTAAVSQRYGESDGAAAAPFTVAVSIPQSAGLHYNMALGMVSSMDSFSGMVSVVRTYTEEEAAAMLDSGEAKAAVIIPDGLIHGIMYGGNIPARVIYPGKPGVETVLFRNLVDDLAGMLSDAQCGVYSIYDIYGEANAPEKSTEQANTKANDSYISTVLGRGSLFTVEQTERISASAQTQTVSGAAAMLIILMGIGLCGYYSAGKPVTDEFLRHMGVRGVPASLATFAGGSAVLFLQTALLTAILCLVPGTSDTVRGGLAGIAAAEAAGCAVVFAPLAFWPQPVSRPTMRMRISITAYTFFMVIFPFSIRR